MKFKVGDNVKVIAGDEKNSSGKIVKIYRAKNKALIEGVNMVKKHTRPTQDNPQGGIVEKEAPVHVSNLMLLVSGKPTRVGYKILENGKKVKVAKSSGEVIN